MVGLPVEPSGSENTGSNHWFSHQYSYKTRCSINIANTFIHLWQQILIITRTSKMLRPFYCRSFNGLLVLLFNHNNPQNTNFVHVYRSSQGEFPSNGVNSINVNSWRCSSAAHNFIRFLIRIEERICEHRRCSFGNLYAADELWHFCWTDKIHHFTDTRFCDEFRSNSSSFGSHLPFKGFQSSLLLHS